MNIQTFDEALHTLKNACPIAGDFEPFTFTKSDVFKSVLRKQLKLNVFGVYCIYGATKEGVKGELMYIGMSGTILANGEMKKQTLGERLMKTACKKSVNKVVQYRISRDQLFSALVGQGKEVIRDRVGECYPKLKGVTFDMLRFECIETYREKQGVPPAAAEAILLSGYLAEWGGLPRMNKEL